MSEYYAEYERLILEKVRFAAMVQLGPQVAHDLDARVTTDWMTDHLVARIQTEILGHKDGTDEQFVVSEVEVLPHKRYVLGLSAPFALLGAALFVVGLHLFASLAFALAFVVAFAYVLARPHKARRTFRVKAERWQRFPENTYVYPKELGRPVVQIMVRAEEA